MTTKNGYLIEILLNSKLWKLITSQNRIFKLTKKETNSLAYSLILEDLLQNFSFELGIDMDNNETPFGKYWKAVNMKGHSKNDTLTQLTTIMIELDSQDDQSKQNLYNFMNLIGMDDSVNYKIKLFIKDFGANKSSWNLKSEEGVMNVKNAYNDALNQTYHWGDVRNDTIIEFWDMLDPNTPSKPKKVIPKTKPDPPVENIQKEDPLPVRHPEPEPEPKREPKPPTPPVIEPDNHSSPFKMNNNPSDFPRKPSRNIQEIDPHESLGPNYNGN